MTTNKDLKLYAAAHGVKLWQIAEKFGVWDSNLSRKMRKEFTDEQKDQFKQVVDEIAGGENNE